MNRRTISAVVLSCVLACGMWAYVLSVLIPVQRAQAAQRHSPRGNLSDLYPRWLGTREWLLHGRDPYSQAITREIQTGYWGRPLDPRNPSDPKDETRFAYPAYVMFLLIPTVHLPFDIVRVIVASLLALGTAVGILFWQRLLGLHLTPAQIAIAIIAGLGSWPIVQGLFLQQLALLVAFLLAAACAAVARGRLCIGGMLLALASIKPQLAGPVLVWLVVWTLSDFRKRQRLGWSFILSMGALLVASELALPGWFTRWRESLGPYLQYNDASPLLATLFGGSVGQPLRILVVGLVAIAAWKARREEASSRKFALTLMLAICAGLLVMPKWTSYDQVMLVPAALWLWHEGKSGRPAAYLLRSLFALCVGWQWGSALLLSLLAIVFPLLAQRLHLAPLVTVLALPLAAFSALVAQSFRRDAVIATAAGCESVVVR